MRTATGSGRSLRCLAAAVILSISGCPLALAQTSTTATAPQVPQAEVLASIIRWTLVAVSQANATGNYTVLRELGSPDFQATNTAAKLSIDFAPWRDQKISLAFVGIVSPQLSQAPSIDASGVLRVIGFYPVRPLQVGFDLTFRMVDGAWRHSSISLAAAPAPPSGAEPAAPLTPNGRPPGANRKPPKSPTAPGSSDVK